MYAVDAFAGGANLSPWFVVLFILIIASYSLIWFGMRRNRRIAKENILYATNRVVEHDFVSDYLIYVGIGLAALGFVVLLLIILRVL